MLHMSKNIFKRLFSTRKRIIVFIFSLIVVGLVVRYFAVKPQAEVKTAKVEKGTVSEELILSGQIKADEHANMAFQGSGELDFLGVKEGQEVKKGDVLARLDTTVLYQAYLQAEANLRRYQASLNNTYDQLQGRGNDESYTQIETRTVAEVNKDNAYRSYVAAQQNLANATLRAPFDGVISSLTYPFTGVNTVFSQPQIEIFNPKTVYFEVVADQTEVLDLTEGQKVKIYLDSYNDQSVDGVVGFIGSTPKVGEVGAVYRIKVLFVSNMSDFRKFKIGMTGDARFVSSEVSDVLYAPADFLKADSKGRYVLVGNQKNKVYVDVGLEGEARVEIKSDKVKVGDTIYD